MHKVFLIKIFPTKFVWLRFYGVAEGRDAAAKEDNAINNIRFYFAHVANGVRKLKYNNHAHWSFS